MQELFNYLQPKLLNDYNLLSCATLFTLLIKIQNLVNYLFRL